MKAFFPKRSVHPVTEYGTGTSESKGDVSIIIPITSELNYFERRLNTQGNLTMVEPVNELNAFVIRKYARGGESPEDAFNEPFKYEVLSPTGQLIYFIAEQTEYFIRGTTCLSKPETMELNVMTPGGVSVMKYFVEFGRSGYSTQITAQQKDGIIGGVNQPCRFISPHKYSIRDSGNKAIMNIKPKDYRFNLFSPSPSVCINQFDIYSSSSRGKGICKGKIQRDSESEIQSYSLSLFHESDTLGKSLLISAVILIVSSYSFTSSILILLSRDLGMSPRRKYGLFNCHVLSCLPQFVASICFYSIFILLLTTFVIIIAGSQKAS